MINSTIIKIEIFFEINTSTLLQNEQKTESENDVLFHMVIT